MSLRYPSKIQKCTSLPSKSITTTTLLFQQPSFCIPCIVSDEAIGVTDDTDDIEERGDGWEGQGCLDERIESVQLWQLVDGDQPPLGGSDAQATVDLREVEFVHLLVWAAEEAADVGIPRAIRKHQPWDLRLRQARPLGHRRTPWAADGSEPELHGHLQTAKYASLYLERKGGPIVEGHRS